MKIEAITVSVGYADYLAATLPHNKGVFDRLLVVTDTKDDETKHVCDHYEVEYLATDVFYENGQVFNKGAGIDAGLRHLDFSDWCLHFDSDIVLSTTSHHRLRTIPMDENVLYGADRLMCESFASWTHFLANPVRQSFPGSCWPIPFKPSYRFLFEYRYLPIGYFQLFNRKAKAFFKYPDFYPTEHDTAATSDSVFGQRWEPEKRQLIEEFFVYHLAEEGFNSIGANWSGRKTPRFGPGVVQ